MKTIPKTPILGVGVSPIDMPAAIQAFSAWVAARDPHYVCVTPAHSIMDGYHDPNLRAIFNASGLTTPDGMAVVWLLRLLGHKQVNRVYGPDLLQAACQASIIPGWRHYFYGGAPGVAQKLADRLQQRYPGLAVAGFESPPYRPLTADEDDSAIARINASSADIVWVGISSPKQEYWMQNHVGRIQAPVLVGVGAAFDFLSGNKPQAPRWIQRSGFEWLYRFASEPRRLWPRYRQYPLFVALVAAQLLHIRRFSS